MEFLGWFGAVTVLAGYILFSTGKLPNGPVYQLLNLVGGLAIAVNVGAHHAIPSLIVNGIWAIVAVVVLTKMLRTRRAEERGEPVEATTAQVLVEPPTTTAVLPVVGPALRDHDDSAAPTTGAGTRAAERDAAPADAPSEAPTAPAPMTETVPVITATIALALVAAAQRDQHERDQRENDPQAQDHEQAGLA
ncbi:CBU_0592 family membrane protein [Curtobacterium luteum]|uniref:CBU_0592 family membrane protein n=1 Tax=Curtobacterium luteum TaxID=33881 RepID=UPI0007366BBC